MRGSIPNTGAVAPGACGSIEGTWNGYETNAHSAARRERSVGALRPDAHVDDGDRERRDGADEAVTPEGQRRESRWRVHRHGERAQGCDVSLCGDIPADDRCRDIFFAPLERHLRRLDDDLDLVCEVAELRLA